MRTVFSVMLSAVVLAFLLCPGVSDADEALAFYAPMWMIRTPASIENIISKARKYHFNQVYLQVRGRGDAYYYPNRDDSAYVNNEPRAELYSLTPSSFDPLQYAIDLGHNGSPKIEVHAWVVMYPAWNRAALPSSPNHVYRQHPEWITEDSSGTTQSPTTDAEGAYLDPGIPEVQDYIFNVFMDIVRNYDIDGIHYDYSRYHTGNWGYDPLAKANFLSETGFNIDTDTGIDGVWHNWKRAQISNLVRRVYRHIKAEKPWIRVSSFLPSFTDTIVNNYQAYNMWSQYGWLDVLQRGSYSNSQSLAVSRYLATQIYNYGDLPVQPPLGSEDTYNNTPDSMIDIITALRAESPPPHGFNHFQYAGLSTNSDERFKSLGDTTYRPDAPYAAAVDVPSSIPDTTPPNAPASASATATTPGEVDVAFSRPDAAADGDFPVQYRIYRHTASPVPEYYDNLKMVFYDDPPTRTCFTWKDVQCTGGTTYYYRIVGYDDYFNKAFVTVNATPTGGGEVIVDNSDPGFSVISGSWITQTSSTDKYGSDYRYNTSGTGADAVKWTPSLSTTGNYEVYVWYPEGSNRPIDAHYTVYYAGGSQAFLVNQTTNGGQWNLLGAFPFNAGSAGYVRLTDESSQASKAVIADAVRFLSVGAAPPTPWEVKPVATSVNTPPASDIVIDNTPQYLFYEDGAGWTTSTWGEVYGTNKSYSSNPTLSAASYVAYLPYVGRYAIDGWIHGNSAYAEHARYRFVHADGVHESVTTQQYSASSTTGDFWINVDGVNDDDSFFFNEGFLFVTLFNTTAADGYTVADAVRIRYLAPATPSFWVNY